MIKKVMLMSILNASLSTNYVQVDSIQYYHTNQLDKQIAFSFSSDFYRVHELLVEIELYSSHGDFKKLMSNTLTIYGSKHAIANFNSEDREGYIVVNVYYENKTVVNKAKFNFYVQENCYLNKTNKNCNLIYLTEYKNNVSREYRDNLVINSDIFDKYLSTNVLNLSLIKLFSNQNLHEKNITLKIYNKINNYEVFYDENYNFELYLLGEKNYSFYLLENNYISLNEFIYSEDYFEGGQETDKIIFPYTVEFK